jgi:peptide deformylase
MQRGKKTMFFQGKHVDKKLNREVERLLKSSRSDGLLPIVAAGDPVLRQQSMKYTGQLSEKTLKKLIAAMRTTMLEAPGVGLAGPQVGIPLAFAVVEDHVDSGDDYGDVDAGDDFGGDDDEAMGSDSDPTSDSDEMEAEDPREFAEFPFHTIINPHYEPLGSETRSFYEGCLSVPGFQAVRRRWLDVNATWQDEDGVEHSERLRGWPARIFQHETDHLSGELYIDKAEIRSLSSDDNLGEYWWEPVPAEAAKTLGFTL